MAGDVYFVGTDIGTLGTKSVVVDLQGRILANDYAEYGVLTPYPLWAEQWPDVWFEAVCRTILGPCHQGAAKQKERKYDPSHRAGTIIRGKNP